MLSLPFKPGSFLRDGVLVAGGNYQSGKKKTEKTGPRK